MKLSEKEIRKQIITLKDSIKSDRIRLSEKRQELANLLTEFKVGDMVKSGNDELFFISGWKISDFSGNLEYRGRKIKKDGMPYQKDSIISNGWNKMELYNG